MVEALVRQVKPEQTDAVADVLRARVKQALVGAPQPTLGRFTILDRVGAGAWGTVYAAYDPVLDRRVALKVITAAPGASADDLLHEARALAMLRHPSVVAVHEAGALGADVWIAMEFVEGQTFRQWLSSDPPVPAIEDALLDAGRGLAAAHAAGLAHGDFKPDNILVGRDGVRVADFGMAALMHGDAASEADDRGGTPPYMAPERLRGGPPSAAADQFAFAVTVFESATGERPFSGQGVPELLAAIDAGPALPRLRRPRSRWLSAARRGLAGVPAQRFASVADMLATIRPRRTSTRTTLLALVVTSAATAAAVVVAQDGADDTCGGGVERIDPAWNPTRAQALRAALEAAAPGFGRPVADGVVTRLDEHRDAWVDAHRRICEATRIQGTQSDALLDLRMQCLQRRRTELEVAADVLSGVSTAREVADASDAVDALTAPGACEGIDAGASEVRSPATDEDRAQAEAIRRTLDHGWALYRVARYDTAARRATEGLQAAEELAFEPVLAEALFLAGTVRGRMGRAEVADGLLRRARLSAATVGDDRLAATISMQLLRSIMFRHRREQVVDLADFVRADAIRAGADPHEVDGIVGEAWLHDGDPERASAAIVLALSTERRPRRIALLHSMLASAHLQRQEVSRALEAYAVALETIREHVGPAHPAVGFHLQRFGRGQLAAGHVEAAHETLSEALQLRVAALGDTDRAVASSLADLARADAALGRDADARERLTRALEIRGAAFGPDDRSLAALHLQLAEVSDDQDAIEHYARARHLRAQDKDVHPELVQAWLGEAATRERQGDTAAAGTARAQAHALARRLPASHPLHQPTPGGDE